jgi:molecular chaperone HtpG
MKFHAEIYQLVTSTINSFYTNKEIFLRELISNWSNLFDKIIYGSLKDTKIFGEQKEINIDIHWNKENKCISITNIGI